ncbi:MAG: hypothetical protein NTX28_13005 [Novosphingobium sp.]|nr:hypothetical protein [Novosphingobium sp.]
MNKNIALLFALVTLLLVAALFEGDGTIPAIAEAGSPARIEAQTQASAADTVEPAVTKREPAMAPVVLSPGQSAPPPPAPSEPDPPFVQPEPLK